MMGFDVFSPEENLVDFITGNIAVNCLTQEDAKVFLEFIESETGLMWVGQYPPTQIISLWPSNGWDTVYLVVDGQLVYGNIRQDLAGRTAYIADSTFLETSPKEVDNTPQWAKAYVQGKKDRGEW